MAKANFVKSARKDNPEAGIKKGESYYWWKFRFGGKHYSKTPPKPSQLTGSEFWSQVLAVQEMLGELTEDGSSRDDIRDAIQDAVSELENLKSETEDKLSNMPDSLQSSPTGELLQGRIDGLESFIDDLNGIDCEDQSAEEILSELSGVEYTGE